MNGWAEGIQNAIQYMEENLTEELKVENIAARAYVSSFHFQRIFSVLCGFTVGEYIRNRRLTLAAQELSLSDVKIIDVAMKYGYDSHDSFTRAFTKFHGISPSKAREEGAPLKSFAPLKLKLTLEGGTMMEYRIEEKAAFTVIGRSRIFNMETSYKEIPEFWREHMQDGGMKVVQGMYGVCLDGGQQEFEYLIADPYKEGDLVPEGYITKVIPAGTWAVFPYRGALPDSLQTVNTRIWNEWLPNCKDYRMGGNFNIEMYTPMTENPEDTYGEIWVPVVKGE